MLTTSEVLAAILAREGVRHWHVVEADGDEGLTSKENQLIHIGVHAPLVVLLHELAHVLCDDYHYSAAFLATEQCLLRAYGLGR